MSNTANFSHTIKKLPKSTIEIDITLPWDTLEFEGKKSFDKLQKELEIEGFRKGKVPADIAKKHIKDEVVYQDAIQSLIPGIYEQIIKKEALAPIIQPKVELISAKANEEWKLKITIAVRPEIKLGEYKKKIKDAKASLKKGDIWVPGKSKEPTDAEKKAQDQQKLNAALSALLTEATVEIPAMLIEGELNERLARLVDDIQKIGMTTEAYLQSKGMTMDKLKEQYTKEIEDTYKIEFILGEISDKEKIEVKKEDFEKLFESIKTDEDRKKAEANSYYYASLLRKQKTLDYLMSL